MKKNVFKGLALMGGLMLTTVSFAQEATTETEETEKKSTTEISGGLDVYSKFGYKNSRTAFTGAEGSLEIGMAAVRVEHQSGKVGAVVDLGFGKRSEEFTLRETSATAKIVNEAYLTYELVDDLVLTGGYFQTHMKYESFRAQENKNYSMSYIFTNLPYLNAGLKADYSINDEFGIMLGVTLPSDFRTIYAAKGTSQKTIIGQINYKADETSAALNFTTGSANGLTNWNTTQIDLVGKHEFSDKFSLGINGAFTTKTDDISGKTGNWFGAALFGTYVLENNLDLNARVEYFDDADGISKIFLGKGGNAFAGTLSANYKINNLTIIPEIRADVASRGIFQGASVNAFGLVAAVYAF